MFSTVFIDIDDTLLDFSLCARESIKITMANAGIDYKEEYFNTFLSENDKLWKDVEKSIISIDELYGIRWNTVFGKIGINYDGPTFEKSFRKNLEAVAVPVNDALEALKYLHKKYTVCATSNAPHFQQKIRLEKAGMSDYIDKLYTSELIGFSKPQKEFFDYCISDLGLVDKRDIILIGDSLTSDIRGGNDYGLTTILFNKNHLEINKNIVPDYTINQMKDITRIL